MSQHVYAAGALTYRLHTCYFGEIVYYWVFPSQTCSVVSLKSTRFCIDFVALPNNLVTPALSCLTIQQIISPERTVFTWRCSCANIEWCHAILCVVRALKVPRCAHSYSRSGDSSPCLEWMDDRMGAFVLELRGNLRHLVHIGRTSI